MNRKIVQIAVATEVTGSFGIDEPGVGSWQGGEDVLYVVADDGTLWRKNPDYAEHYPVGHKKREFWVCLPALPDSL